MSTSVIPAPSAGIAGVTSLNGQTGAVTLKKINGNDLDGSGSIAVSGEVIDIDSVLSVTSENPIQNQAVTKELNKKGTYSKPQNGIPTSDLADGSVTRTKLATSVDAWIDNKQAGLISGVNIKSINGHSLVDGLNEETDIVIGGGSIILDDAPTQGSSNAAKSGGIYTALSGKAASDHTHALSLAQDSSGSSSIALAANTKYKLTAGGSTYTFTTPPDSGGGTAGVTSINTKSGALTLRTINNIDLLDGGGNIDISGSGTITIDNSLDTSSSNPVKNSAIATEVNKKADKSATVSTVAWDSTNKKITKTINGNTTDVVTAANILNNLTSSQVTTALGYTPPSSDTNTHRPIQVNGTQILGDNTTPLNLKGSGNVTISNSNGTVTIYGSGSTRTYTKPYYINTSGEVVECNTIQAAIDGCPLHGKVTIPWYGETYVVSSTIHIWKPITLESDYSGYFPWANIAYTSTSSTAEPPAYASQTNKIQAGEYNAESGVY